MHAFTTGAATSSAYLIMKMNLMGMQLDGNVVVNRAGPVVFRVVKSVAQMAGKTRLNLRFYED